MTRTCVQDTHSLSHIHTCTHTLSCFCVCYVSDQQRTLTYTNTHTHTHTHTRAQSGGKKRTRTNISPEQLGILQRVFESEPIPTREKREQLAKMLGLRNRVVQVGVFFPLFISSPSSLICHLCRCVFCAPSSPPPSPPPSPSPSHGPLYTDHLLFPPQTTHIHIHADVGVVSEPPCKDAASQRLWHGRGALSIFPLSFPRNRCLCSALRWRCGLPPR